MRDFHKNTCIRFIPRTKENNYIKLKKTGDGLVNFRTYIEKLTLIIQVSSFPFDIRCWSYIGRKRGNQTVSLDKGCVDKGTVLHELMHAAGFLHEQSRTDRDKFVTIHWDNIDPGMCLNIILNFYIY